MLAARDGPYVKKNNGMVLKCGNDRHVLYNFPG